ncbi:hypothetical protein GCM10027062_11880 [Nocardioides hungaricus]
MNVGAVVVAIGCALVVAMTTWCILRVRHWRGVAERASPSGYGRCRAADLRPGDLCFVWAYVLEHGEWRHGTVTRAEHDALDTAEVQLVRLVFAEGASFTAKPFSPAWVLPVA